MDNHYRVVRQRTYDWPRHLQQLTTLALLIGLPIVLVLAWYHGDRHLPVILKRLSLSISAPMDRPFVEGKDGWLFERSIR